LIVRPDIVAGTTVTIERGMFIGCRGVVVRRQGVDRLVVNLPLLGHSVEAVIPAMTALPVAG
jgi:transcription antitermination factor NusG